MTEIRSTNIREIKAVLVDGQHIADIVPDRWLGGWLCEETFGANQVLCRGETFEEVAAKVKKMGLRP